MRPFARGADLAHSVRRLPCAGTRILPRFAGLALVVRGKPGLVRPFAGGTALALVVRDKPGLVRPFAGGTAALALVVRGKPGLVRPFAGGTALAWRCAHEHFEVTTFHFVRAP